MVTGIYEQISDESAGDIDIDGPYELPEWSIIGEKFLRGIEDHQNGNPFGKVRADHTVLCSSSEGTECLVMDVKMFEKQILMYYSIQKGELFQFLLTFMHEVFGDLGKAKILDLSQNYMKIINVPEGNFVYDMSDDSDKVYIVREGELIHDTILEVDTSVKFPSDCHSWEIDLTTRTIMYRVRDLAKGGYFGHEEILNDDELHKDDK